MALRSILNNCVHKSKPYRQFSSSRLSVRNIGAYPKNYNLPSLPVLPTPWLMCHPKDGPNGPTDTYCNIFDNSIVEIERPKHWSVPLTRKRVGSAKWWVVFDCDSDGSLFLANPYTNKATSHKLPPPSASPQMYKVGLHLTLVGDPMSNNFSLIQDKRGLFNKLCLAAYNRKADTFYKLHFEDSGKLRLIIRSPPLKDDETRVLSLFVDPEVVKTYDEFEDSWEHSVEKYLVVSEENEPGLFLVIRHVANEKPVESKTKDIELYKIDLESGGKMECVGSIGDKALFLDINSEPFFISTRNCSGVKSNCVYFADECNGFFELEKKCTTTFESERRRKKLEEDPYYCSSEDEDEDEDRYDKDNRYYFRRTVYWVAPPFLV